MRFISKLFGVRAPSFGFASTVQPLTQKTHENETYETKFKAIILAVCHSLGALVCVGKIFLLASSAQAQNLFAGSSSSGNVYEFTPGGAQSIFASGLTPTALAFNSAGDLFVANKGIGNGPSPSISEITPSGTQTTFATGFTDPKGLAFDIVGDLFVADNATGNIYEFTPGGVRSTFASGVYGNGMAFDSAGNLYVSDGSTIYKYTPGGAQSTFAPVVRRYGTRL